VLTGIAILTGFVSQASFWLPAMLVWQVTAAAATTGHIVGVRATAAFRRHLHIDFRRVLDTVGRPS
jgi:hypothetical protein